MDDRRRVIVGSIPPQLPSTPTVIPHVIDARIPEEHAIPYYVEDLEAWTAKAEAYEARAAALVEQLVDCQVGSPVHRQLCRMYDRAAALGRHYRAHIDAHTPKPQGDTPAT